MNTGLNVMPSPTWNRLQINESEYGMPVVDSINSKFENKTFSVDSIKLLDKGFEACKDIVTGTGEALDDFVKKNANVRNYFEINENIEEPILFTYYLDTKENVLVDDNEIVVKAGCKATIIQKFYSERRKEVQHLGSTRIHVEEGGKLLLIQLQYLGSKAEHYAGIGIKGEAESQIDVIRADLGASKAIAGVRCDLTGKKADFNLSTLYYGDGNRYLDFNDVVNHIAKKTTSNMEANGALFDSCKKRYRGTIDFKRGCADSLGHESENTLLFSDEAQNKSAPIILCAEESVSGEHAATIGRIDEALLFYIQSRGLDEEAAKELMIESSFAPTIDRIPDEELRNSILTCLAKRSNNKDCQFNNQDC